MADLWATIVEIAVVTSYERLDSAAKKIEKLSGASAIRRHPGIFGPNLSSEGWKVFVEAWEASPEVAPQAVAGALRTSARMSEMLDGGQKIDLVWTGPSSTFVPMRSTEQVMLELIGRATKSLFLVTYVNYGAAKVIAALNDAALRGVTVKMLLEGTKDTTTKMAKSVQGATIYFWADDAKPSVSGKTPPTVHAKCVVADRGEALVTSANLTDHALERNMELGVHIWGGRESEQLHDHLNALVQTKEIVEFGSQ